jgi:D-glycero-D-manno-heptose 1,7-bisphosphate phosphatase
LGSDSPKAAIQSRLMAVETSSAADGRFDQDLGLWIWVSPRAGAASGGALFLDRDGVIVEDPGYLSRAAEIVMIPGSAGLIAEANRLGVPVVEVTNQAGVGRGYYGWNDFREVEAAIARELARSGAWLDAVIACPYHPEGIAPWTHPHHPGRKPQPGMLLAAGRLLPIDLKRSWIAGDKLDDLLAGYNAGLRGGLHVLTGHGRAQRQAVMEWHPQDFDVRFSDQLGDATAFLHSMYSSGGTTGPVP